MALFICYIFCTLLFIISVSTHFLECTCNCDKLLNGSSPVLLSSNNDADDALLVAGINVVVTAKRNYKRFTFLSVLKLHIQANNNNELDST
jgi:hypothetical protein